MSEHYKTLSAVFPVIFRTVGQTAQVLLLRRANTGYMDGLWDFAGSGHVEADETASQTVVRECREELGITAPPQALTFAHLSHRLGRNGTRTYYDLYFVVRHFEGEPSRKEPEKCSALQWFAIDQLPDDMIGVRKDALRSCLQGIPYSEVID